MKTDNKWRTPHCARCGYAHSGYTGKLDSAGIEYVVCGSTHKRMDVVLTEQSKVLDYLVYPTQ